jgi:hypothetical protein
MTFSCWRNTVRIFATTLLICLLVACPLFCRAAETGCSHELSEASSGPPDDSHIPPSCPDDGVCCICAGATQTGDVRAADLASSELPPSLDGRFLPLLPAPHIFVVQYFTLEEPPVGLAVFGDALGVRAFLQDFRF